MFAYRYVANTILKYDNVCMDSGSDTSNTNGWGSNTNNHAKSAIGRFLCTADVIPNSQAYYKYIHIYIYIERERDTYIYIYIYISKLPVIPNSHYPERLLLLRQHTPAGRAFRCVRDA